MGQASPWLYAREYFPQMLKDFLVPWPRNHRDNNQEHNTFLHGAGRELAPRGVQFAFPLGRSLLPALHPGIYSNFRFSWWLLARMGEEFHAHAREV